MILCCKASVAKSVSSCVPVALVSRVLVDVMCRLGTLVFLGASAVGRGGKCEGKDMVEG